MTFDFSPDALKRINRIISSFSKLEDKLQQDYDLALCLRESEYGKWYANNDPDIVKYPPLINNVVFCKKLIQQIKDYPNENIAIINLVIEHCIFALKVYKDYEDRGFSKLEKNYNHENFRLGIIKTSLEEHRQKHEEKQKLVSDFIELLKSWKKAK